ncbi:MAG TPA: transposase, partial [Pseudonocardiaceae bacterium]
MFVAGCEENQAKFHAQFDHIILLSAPGKSNEITAFAPLLNRIDITDAIIPTDALHTQHRHADYLHGRGAHYVLTVKRNHPGMHRQIRALP